MEFRLKSEYAAPRKRVLIRASELPREVLTAPERKAVVDAVREVGREGGHRILAREEVFHSVLQNGP